MKKVCFSNRNIGQIYYVFVLISSLFYFFSSLRRGDQSTVFALVLSPNRVIQTQFLTRNSARSGKLRPGPKSVF